MVINRNLWMGWRCGIMCSLFLQPGDILQKRYYIQELLGSGGMAKVYLAKDLRLEGRLWAVKESKSNVDFKSFLDEAKMLASLDHATLPKIIDYYPPNAEGYSYIITDYIRGETLADLFTKTEYKLELEDILHYSIQLCDVLDYLHTLPEPIIYRDLKPSNVMINEQNQIRLIDFGIARSYKEGQALDTVALGTIGFAAPERYESTQSDHRTDIYSLGALLYYLLSKGQYVTPLSESLANIRSDLPVQLIQIVKTSLANHASERYQTALDMKHELLLLSSSINKHVAPTVLLHPLKPTYEQTYEQTSIKNVTTPLFKYNQTIAITSLSEGAGSSFLTHMLATAVTDYDVQPSIMEQPSKHPFYFETAGLESKAPRFVDPYESGQSPDRKKRMITDNIADGICWLVPKGKQEYTWSKNELKEIIFMCNSSILFIDLGYRGLLWEEVLKRATLLLIVVDALPSQLNRFQDRLLFYQQLKRDGFPIQFVVNHVPQICDRKELEKALYYKPIAWITQVSQEEIYKASVKGMSVYSLQKSREKLISECQLILSQILPVSIYSQHHRERKSLFSFLKK
jgi:serine/threonine protein kinase